MRDFAICKYFTVPVDEITGIEADIERERLEVKTKTDFYVIEKEKEAVRFIRSLEEQASVNAAGVSDMEIYLSAILGEGT